MNILLSTSNIHKVEFIKSATKGLDIKFFTPKELGLKLDVEENGETAVDNAIIKARALSKVSGMPTFAWDMGMKIDELPENMQPNLHVRRPFGEEELSDVDMVEYWRNLICEKCPKGESLAHHFDGIALMNGDNLISSASFDEEPFVFTSIKKEQGVPKFNAFDQVRKTLDGKYFCDLTDEENLRYDKQRANEIKIFFENCLQKLKKAIKVVTICGSMKFSKEMIEIASNLEKEKGWCIIQCVYNIDQNNTTKKEMDNIVNAHWKKIDISDAIYVVNIEGYIGNSTKNEIKYALDKSKEVIYHEPIL